MFSNNEIQARNVKDHQVTKADNRFFLAGCRPFSGIVRRAC